MRPKDFRKSLSGRGNPIVQLSEPESSSNIRIGSYLHNRCQSVYFTCLSTPTGFFDRLGYSLPGKTYGQFIDMPDGRWHYAYIVDSLRLNTAPFSRGIFCPKTMSKSNSFENGSICMVRNLRSNRLMTTKIAKTDFRFAFVREDLIGQLEHPEFFDIEYLKKFVGDESELTNRGWSDCLYKDYPSWLPAKSITITYEEYGNKL